MTRFAWMQTRAQTFTATAALVAIAVVAIVTGLHLAHLYDTLIAHCQTNGDCSNATGQFLDHDSFLQKAFGFLMRVAPALFGIFWGAPLVAREFETGTFRLAWTQSVSRTRWLIIRLAVGGATTAVVAGLLTLAITWWFRGLDLVGADQYGNFDERDIAPIAYAVFAFAVGALLGAIIRRTIPAMAASLGIFAFVRVAVTFWVRPNLITPLHITESLASTQRFGFTITNGGSVSMVAGGVNVPNAWVQSTHIATSSGQISTAAERADFLQQYCPTIGHPSLPSPGAGRAPVARGNATAFQQCQTQAERLFHVVVSYQPASRYWTFQWYETAIFIALAMAACAACYWWVTRRAV